MKKTIFTILILTAFISCKNDSKSENQETQQNNSLMHLKGEFVYYNGAAVLQTQTDIYGVLITNKLEELNKQAETYKTEPTDMVLVEIRGNVTNQKDEKILWDKKVEIMDILSVQPIANEKDKVIKLGN